MMASLCSSSACLSFVSRYALAISGFIAAALQLICMPILLRKYDHSRLYSFFTGIWAFTFAAFPLLRWIAESNGGNDDIGSGTSDTYLWISIAAILFLARIGFLGCSINTLLVKKHVTVAKDLGSATGSLQISICLARCEAPTLSAVCSLYLPDYRAIGDSDDRNCLCRKKDCAESRG
ncbi:hypothetical protein C8J56DRAFT_224943 [Mycena floridula]|nr:hypothetical protein C8J56DRAFT_224943 [Mycena floridula]